MRLVLIAAAAGLALTATAPAAAEERIALVIGNSAYERQGWALANPVNDARLIAARLESLDFAVDLVLDADRAAMVAAFQRYGASLRDAGPDAVSVVYYAGHGVQDDGVNYLVPVDSDAVTTEDVAFDSPNMNRLLRYMAEAGNPVNLVLLDACRNNPMESEFRGFSVGLAPIERTANVLIGYAAAAGRTAADGDGANSPFAFALDRALADSAHEPIALVMGDVGAAVFTATGGRQTPEYRSGLVRAPRWAFSAPPESPPAGPAAPAPQPEPDDPEASAATNISAFLETVSYDGGEVTTLAVLRLIVGAYGLPAVEAAAAVGDPRAAAALGRGYAAGEVVPQDLPRAVSLFAVACDGGEAAGCNNLGVSYEDGRGVDQDVERARALFGRACDLGLAVSCFNLAASRVRDPAADLEAVLELYRRACEQSFARACEEAALLAVELSRNP